MSKKADVINLERPKGENSQAKKLQLDSGRYILIRSEQEEELLEIVQGEEVVVTVRLTDKGSVVTVQGAHLELKSTESLALEAKEVRIKAEEEASIESMGRLKIDSAKKMDIYSEEDIRVVGKIIHLN